MQKFNSWRLIALALLISLIAGACGNLAGDVQIVATVVPQVQATLIPLEHPANAPDVANGQRLFTQNCTSCHGINGVGDGELVENGSVPRMGSFLDPVHVRQQSPEYYYNTITNGNLINLMPPWSGSLSVQDRWDVAMYVYTLQYSEAQISQGEILVENPSTEIQLAGDNELAGETGLEGEDAFAAVAYQRTQSIQNWGVDPVDIPQLENVNFSGVITQGSPNAILPQDIRLQLQYGDFIETFDAVDGVIDENGQFSFNDIPVSENNTYFAVAFYDGRPFLSESLTTRELQASNTVDITLYETSTAPNIINLTGIELILEYLTVPDLGTGIIVNQFYVYENPTDYVFHLEPEGQDIRVSLLISLPIGAVMLNAQEQGNFIPVQDEYMLIDTRPVYPGEHYSETSYFIPYETDAQTIDIRMNNQFSGDVKIIVVDPGLSISGELLSYSEDINVASEDDPVMASVYTGTVDLQSGSSFIFDIEGNVNQTNGATVLTGDQFIPVLIVVVILVIVLVAGMMFYLRGGRSRIQGEIDSLIIEISRLEDMHDAGQMNHDVFQQKRSELKARLSELMKESQAE